MKSPTHQRRVKRGSALLTMMFLMGIMALLTGSILRYSAAERRGNERNRLILRAKNMAENIALYAAEQLTTKLYRLGSTPVGRFPTAASGTTGGSSTEIHTPPSEVLTTDCVSFEMKIAIEEASPYTLVNDPTSPNNGLQVGIAKVPIIAKATAMHAALGNVTAYVQQDMELALTPLFQFGMFYNMDMELYPSQDFTVTGPVHTNNRLMAHPDGSAQKTILFMDRVTAADHLIADHSLKARPRGSGGSFNDPVLADGQVVFAHTNGTQTSLKDSTSMTSGSWRDHRWKTTDYPPTASEIASFKTWATTTYNGNLRTSAHGVTKLELPGIGSYKETNDSNTPEDDRNNGRQIIESPDQKRWNSSSNTFAWTTDTAALKTTKISWRAGLYIMANPDNDYRSGKLPSGTTVTLLPFTYRCWLNETNTDGTHTCTEIVLPGQPSYGYNAGPDGLVGTTDDYMYRNNLPNAYTNYTSVGSNQVLRIPQQPYGTGTGYTTSAAYALGDTSLTLASDANTVLGTILAGDTVTIGTAKYTVRTSLTAANVLVLTSPGLRAAVGAGTRVFVDGPVGATTTGTGYKVNGAHAVAATAITVNTGTGQILAGSSIIIGAYRYLVTGALEGNVVTIATPGLRVAVAHGTDAQVDPMSGTRGTGNRYQINNAGGYAINAQGPFTVDTGAGTIVPGNTISIGGYTYTVASVNGATALPTPSGASTIISVTPGLYAAVADNAVITLNPAITTGYSHNFGTGSGYRINLGGGYAVGATDLAVDTGAGTVFPGDILSIGGQKYTVNSATNGTPVTSIKLLSPGLIAAVADNATITLDSATTGPAFPADSTTTPWVEEAYFFDLRRANGSGAMGTAGNATDFGRGTTAFVPRPLAKIDFDMARFKMMVNRSVYGAVTSSGYYVQAPAAGNWANSIYNSAGTATNLGLGMGAAFNIFPGGANLAEKIRQDPFQIYVAPDNPETNATQDAIIAAAGADPRAYAITPASLTSAWYDGLAIYIHSVDAEQRSQTVAGLADRIDSGVRLWNGRGLLASLTPAGDTGLTFCTNDAAYIIGHYNADGTINATATDNTANGGFSARYPDVAGEKLCAVMGDAVTIVAQPTYTLNTGVYSQTNGWCDAYSALPVVASSGGWSTSAAGSDDGVATPTDIRPGLLPTTNQPGPFGAVSDIKLAAVSTEVSTALLVGIVPSNHSPTGLTDRAPNTGANNVNSGGANNFPRLLDNWTGDSLYIRGSMVALFESRVAMEPFTHSRCYRAPGRYWGLHQGFRTANHDVPLEPIVLSATRMGFRELSATEYNAKKAEITALTAIP